MHFITQSEWLPDAARVVGLFQDNGFDAAGQAIDTASQGALSALKKRGLLKGKSGEMQWLHDVAGVGASVLVVGLGKAEKWNADSYIKTLKATAKAVLKMPFKSVQLSLSANPITGTIPGAPNALWALSQAVLQFNYALYKFDRLKSEPSPTPALETVALMTTETAEAAAAVIAPAQSLANGITLTRELVNLPANIGTPSYLANEAQELAKAYKHISIEVLDHAACEKLGMASFLSVTRGSPLPAHFIILHYRGTTEDVAPTVLIGKGITFDTGGISLKPASDMHEMKMDMGGAASVLGTFRTLGELQPALHVIGLIPTCENMPSGTATRPGDVVKSLSGKTIEILNTDAEGRLILADALTYAERFKPKTVIDIATLTGACIIALGTEVAALYSDNDELANALLESSQRTRDHLWRMPIVDSYLEGLTKSSCADIANVTNSRAAGSIVAACFLKEFAKGYHWAHLDIAGVAKENSKEFIATGRPVSVLVDYLLHQV